MFKALQPELLIGLESRQQHETSKPLNERAERSFEPIEIYFNAWDIMGYFSKIDGDIEQTALISGPLTIRYLGTTNVGQIASVQALKAFAPGLQMADDLAIVVYKDNQRPAVSVDDIKKKANARIIRAQLASQLYKDSRRAQPDLEALMIGVKAAFRI